MEVMSKLVWSAADTPEELAPLLNALSEEYPVSDGGRGLKLKFKRIKADETISRVIRSKGGVEVEYTSIPAAARGIGSALARIEGENKTPFTTIGIMLDVSRNMVMTVEHLKMWFRRLALAGCNFVMLYCEDTYELDDEPVFGYMRGAYSLEEIRELDNYAKKLGIELVGCIQTLGHLEQLMQWSVFDKVRDTRSVLLVDQPETYELIEKMIKFWSEALDSRRIHIGMDETHDLGRGVFLDRSGYERGFDIFNRHLAKVNEICAKYQLSPMLWSDMYFRLSNPRQDYYDLESEIPADVKAAIPKNVQLVYWDYYHEDADIFSGMIRRHRELGFEPVMGSGIWTWAKLWYDHEQTEKTIVPCIESCRKEKVKELFFTMWGDDGAYCNYDSSLAGIFYAADLAFGENGREKTEQRFNNLCGPADFNAHIAAGDINAVLEDKNGELFKVQPSSLVWDDPLQGIVFHDYRRRNPEFDLLLLDLYEELRCMLMPFAELSGAGDMEHMLNILTLLIKKLEFQGALYAAYNQGDRLALREIAVNVIPPVIAAADEFDSGFRRQWLACAKSFGLERIQSRNATLIARLEETSLRLREFLAGEIDRIDELECQLPSSVPPLGLMNRYGIISAGTAII